MGMRSLRAPQLLRYGTRPLDIIYQAARPVIYNGYCSTCDSKPNPAGIATAIANPPIPPADHRQLAVDQKLFTTSIYSPGSPLFLPNGTLIFHKLTAFLRAQYKLFGFKEVITPTIYKKSLWQKSGHWENYAEDMFSVTGRGASGEAEGRHIGEDEEFGLKPMNCPGHCILFSSEQRSVREMPVRYADFSPLHRNEISGALSGLTRVRRFHQDDGHIFCRPSQVGEEISRTLQFVRLAYKTFNLGPYRLALSTRPKDHYIGTADEWDSAEMALREALDASGQVWSINEGDGAFYGPKIDIILKDSDGKEHQTATIQLDFQLPKRFELEYTAPAPELEQRGMTTTDPELLAMSGPVRPVMIHRAILGSVERFMALLIEHYNGRWPFWLNPRQVMVITVNNEKAVVDYALEAIDVIQGGGLGEAGLGGPGDDNATSVPYHDVQPVELDRSTFAIDIDDSPRSVKKKISEAKRKRYSIIIVVGKKNVESGQSVTVDFRGVSQSQAIIGRELMMLGRQPQNGENTDDTVSKFKQSDNDQFSQGLSAEELKELDVQPHKLREILLELQKAYQ